MRFYKQSGIYYTVMELPQIAPRVLYTIGDFNITVTMFTSLLVTVALIVFAVIVRVACIPRWNKNILSVTPLRMLLEWIVGMFSNDSEELDYDLFYA